MLDSPVCFVHICVYIFLINFLQAEVCQFLVELQDGRGTAVVDFRMMSMAFDDGTECRIRHFATGMRDNGR